MKKSIIFLFFAIIFTNCKEHNIKLRDGFYEVTNTNNSIQSKLAANEVQVNYNSIYNEQDFTKVTLDTSEFVPLELEMTPSIQKDSLQKSQLTVTLSQESIEILRKFTSTRLMKTIAIVLDNEAITAHKIKDTINGGTMVISWCGENACKKLHTRMSEKVKK